MTGSRVFITQEPFLNKDFSSASNYGAIHYIFTREESPCLVPIKSIFNVRQKLRDFNPDKDYIINSGGDPINGILVGSVLLTLGIKKFTFLRWDRTKDLNGRVTNVGFYVPVTIDLSNF